MANKHTLSWWLWVLFGLLLQIGCGYVGRQMPTPQNIFSWLGMLGTIVLIFSCMRLAEEKGYVRNYGLLGILSLIGVIVLALLPDRSEKG